MNRKSKNSDSGDEKGHRSGLFVLYFCFVLLFVSRILFAQADDTFWVWVDHVELQPAPDRVYVRPKNFLKFADQVILERIKGDFGEIRTLDNNITGWIPLVYCTKREKEIRFFKENGLIPTSVFIIKEEDAANGNLTIKSYNTHDESELIKPRNGYTIIYRGKVLERPIQVRLFGTFFDDPQPSYRYIYTDSFFLELKPSNRKGFLITRKIYPENRVEELGLYEALINNKITAVFYGMGKSSGDAIRAKIFRTVENPLRLKLNTPFILESLDGRYQNMIVTKLKGKPIDKKKIQALEQIDLSASIGGDFIFEAYCLELEKKNPSEETFFKVYTPQEDLSSFIDFVYNSGGKNMELIQISLWLFQDEPKEEIATRFPVSADLIDKAEKLVERFRKTRKDTIRHPDIDQEDLYYYTDYSYKNIDELAESHSRINFKNINYPLLHACIFHETNRQRALNGVALFKHSSRLEKAALQHSRDMVKYDFFSHQSPVPGKKSLSDRLKQVGISSVAMAENIAIQFGLEYEQGKLVYTPDQNNGYFSYKYKGKPINNHTYLSFARAVVQQWMESPGHRANILNSRLNYLGVGAAHFQKSDFYNIDAFKVTQNFAGKISN